MFGWWDSMTTTKKLTSLGILCLGTYLSFTFFQTKNHQQETKMKKKTKKLDSETKSTDVSTAQLIIHKNEQKQERNNVNPSKKLILRCYSFTLLTHSTNVFWKTS
jgi:Ca2+/H+ antiporter